MYANLRAYKNLNYFNMNTRITSIPLKLMAASLVLISCFGTSCTSLQQTTVAATDDLYYTPSTEATKATAQTNGDRNNEQINNASEAEYQDYQSYPDDRYLRLKVANRNRWDAIDDFGYWNDPRFNYSYYPSYLGWNSWYSGFYGSSWYNPFGMNMGFGWGGYAPYMSAFNYGGWGWGMGWDDFGFAGMGWGGMGWGGFGWGGMGWGGMGWGGWNPYYAGYWNPYGYYYGGGYGGGFVGGIPNRRIHFQDPRATQNSAPGLAAYRRPSSNGNFNNTSNTVNGNTRYAGNANLNNNFGSLIKRVVTNNANTNYANSWDRPSRSFSNNNNNQFKTTSTNSSNNSNYSPATNSNSNTGGRSGGFNSAGSSTGGSRAPRSNN
jgi:hypothetical protein